MPRRRRHSRELLVLLGFHGVFLLEFMGQHLPPAVFIPDAGHQPLAQPLAVAVLEGFRMDSRFPHP